MAGGVMGWGGAIHAMTGLAWSAYLNDHGARVEQAQLQTRHRMYLSRPTKCPSCGSREFVEHRGQSVCSYCRGTA